MSLMMRRNLMADGGWKNPYVTDGLVAMWDGYWNAGPGVHDASRVYPIELVNRIEHDNTYKSGTPTTGENYFAIDENADSDGYFTYLIPGIGDVIRVDDGKFTLEQCAKHSGPRGTHRNYVQNTGNPGVGSDTCCASIGTQYYYTFSRYPMGGINDAQNYDPVKDKKYSMSVAFNDSSANFYVDGIERSISGRGYANSSHGDYIMFGTRLSNHRGFWHSVRIYNRTLSAAEIAANYAVDKARFGLP